MIPLHVKIGFDLWVTVKEFQPPELNLETRHAHRTVENGDGKQCEQEKVWNPPIIMYIKQGCLSMEVAATREQILKLFKSVLDDHEKWDDWTIKYFPEKEEDFQTTILRIVGKYYRNDIEEHTILKTGLSLLWFEYLLLNKFTVPRSAVPQLERNLEARRPDGAPEDIEVIPDTINRFLKAIILPMAMDAAKKVAETLHSMAFEMAASQTHSQGKTDVALCLAFILMMYLGRTQATLLLLSDYPSNEIDIEYGREQADYQIGEMERSVSDHLVSLHKYALSRKPSESSGLPAVDTAFEKHAREYSLVHQLRQAVEKDYGRFDTSNPGFSLIQW